MRRKSRDMLSVLVTATESKLKLSQNKAANSGQDKICTDLMKQKLSAADRLLSIWLVLDIKQWSQKQWRWQTLWIPHHFFTPNSADRQSAPPPWKLCYKNTELIFGCVVELWESFEDMHWQSKQKGGQHYYNGRWSELPIYQQQVLHVCSNGEEAVCEKTLGNNNLQKHYKETDRERMSSRERCWEKLAE